MKKIFIMFLLIFNFAFSQMISFADLKDLSSNVKETLFINNEKKIREYDLKYIYPDYMRKEIVFPNVNKGEIHLYNSGKKQVYIPLFDEVIDEEGTVEDSSIITIIDSLKNMEKNDKNFFKKYRNREIKKIKYQEKYLIEFKEFKDIDNFLLPTNINVYENNQKIVNLELRENKINSGLLKEEIK